MIYRLIVSAMTNRNPNSCRYWRLNSLIALRETRESEQNAEDPDHLKIIKANNAELATLEIRERAVKARYARFKQKIATHE